MANVSHESPPVVGLDGFLHRSDRHGSHPVRLRRPAPLPPADAIYGEAFRQRIAGIGIGEVLSAPRSPWQNPYAERLIGSIRRDCLNHFVILNARHLKRALASYFAYYHGSRTHLGLDKQCPFPRPVLSMGRIVEIPQLGGLHHRYERVAA